jgi:hypothetical protein
LSLPPPSEFYKRFRNAPEAAKKQAFELGQEMGRMLVKEFNIKGNDVKSIAAVLNALVGRITVEAPARIEDNKVIISNRAFCPIMLSSMSLNLPWLWLCPNLAWPFMQGAASVVNPLVRLTVPSWRAKGDPVCDHVFEVK